MKEHLYTITLKWTGNSGNGTKDYRSYERSHKIYTENKPEILGSSDPAFRGDKTKYNPEELFVASLSSCHMLWFLHFCADQGITVVDYIDNPTGVMVVTETGAGKFIKVTLNPTITVTDASMVDKIESLHKKAHEFCFIANSVNFPVEHNSTIIVKNR